MVDYKLFVRNLAPEVTDEILQSSFSPYGTISFCHICMDQDSQTSRGFGFVCFTTSEAAAGAVDALNGAEIEGKAIEVKQVESSRPARSENPIFQMECYAFKKGACKFGSQCRFSHASSSPSDAPEQQPQQQEQPRQDAVMEEEPVAVAEVPLPRESTESVKSQPAAKKGKKKQNKD